MSGMGPSLPELGRRTGHTDRQMGWILGIRAFGYFAGSMGGPLFDSLPGNSVLVVALAVCSASCALLSIARSYLLLFFIVPFQGICMGLLDTGGNVMTLWLHPKDPEPFMQMLHFFFALGGLLAPLLIGQVGKHMDGSITVSWCVIAALFVPAILLLLRYESPREPPRAITEDGETVTYKGWLLVVLIGTAAFLFFDIGAEAGLATYLVTYIVRRDLSDETTATVVNSVFWVAMVVGRLIAIPVSTFVKSSTIIISSSTLCVASTVLWLATVKSFASLTISMILYGLGMSVAFATGVLLAQTYIPISGRAGTIFVIGAAFGEFIIPISVSQLFDVTHYLSLPIFMLGASIICFLLVFFIMYAGSRCPKTMSAPEPGKDLDLVVSDGNEDGSANHNVPSISITSDTSAYALPTLNGASTRNGNSENGNSERLAQGTTPASSNGTSSPQKKSVASLDTGSGTDDGDPDAQTVTLDI